MTTGERIKARRKELGLTADAVAEQIGISRSTMFRYEKGEIEKLPINNLVPIARVLCTTVGYLMGWDDEKSPTSIEGRAYAVLCLPDGGQARGGTELPALPCINR